MQTIEANSMMVAFWEWWRAELASFLPITSMQAAANRVSQAELHVNGGRFSLHTRQQLKVRLAGTEGQGPLAEFMPLFGDKDRIRRVIVSFGPDDFFERRTSLPNAALPHAPAALALDLKRVLPVPKQELFTGWEQFGRTKSGAIDFIQIAAKKSLVETVLRHLHELRLQPVAVAFRDAQGTALPVVLDPDGRKFGAAAQSAWSKVTLTLLATLIVLSGAVAWLAIGQQRSQLAAVVTAIEQVWPKALAVRRTVEQARARTDQIENLQRLRTEAVSTTAVWEEIAIRLPDQAWLTSYAMKGRTVTAEGFADNAENLVSLLESSALFKNVHFTAPLLKNPGESKTRFSIAFDVEEPAR
jgi:Tfp pilus assembly protein PilN